MMKTRRQSKQAAAVATGVATRETSPVPPQTQVQWTVAIPEDLDFDLLSDLLPETQFDSPTPESIVSLYRLVVAQASAVDANQKELEETKAEVQKKEVELDQALQDRESASKEVESVSENLQSQLKKIQQEKEEIVVSRNNLQAQLSSVSSSTSASSHEVEVLKQRVEDTEREKRDLIGVISRLKEDTTQREEEIHTLRSNLKQARQDYQALESQLRELRSAETANKFKIDSLSQQLSLTQTEAQRASSELAAKTEEFANYRRSKHAELANLQADRDSLDQRFSALESSHKALQLSYNSQAHQLTEALTRIQDLTGQLAEQEATYSSEAAGLKRLVEMMEDREAQAKAIVENIEKEWAGVGDRAERREAVLKEEIESQRARAEEAENRVADLQKILDRLDRGEFPVPFGASASVPSTPARGHGTPSVNGTPDFLTSGIMGLSPTVAMASRAQRGGKTFTEVYADYVKLQEELTKKTAECDHMDRTLSQVLAQIEERAPILAQQRQEYERMQAEATLLASQLAQALTERDSHAAAAEQGSQKLAKSTRENELLTRQLDDLARQVQGLLKELGRQQDPAIPSDEELGADPNTVPPENIDAVITNSLVLFRSLPQLQQQNQRLLKIVHELGRKMEDEEKDYREQLEAEQQVALQEAYSAVKELQDQLQNHRKSSELTIQTYMKERDALKSMLARERRSGGASRLGGTDGHDEEMALETDTAKELAEIQSQFETYKTEMGVDSTRVRDELIAMRHEASQAAIQLAKANAKVEHLTERQRMLQDMASMQSRDIENLQRRNQELHDQNTRIDIQLNRVSEDLLLATSQNEQLRNETTNLRAERKIWEAVQARLVEENKTLTIERSQLSDLMTNVQRMHSDMEQSGENDRRRLESQIVMLENQTQELRTQLNEERESARHATLLKDLELKELRTRIDKTNEDYAKTRELLAVAETNKAHLDDKVEQLTRQLRGNEEKLAVYERRPTGAQGAVQRMDEDLTHEQQLEAEVAELRSALKVAEVDLVAARSHVQQFQEISQANEAALAALNATYDQYVASSEAQIAKHESEYNALRVQLESTQQEFAQLNQKHSELKETLAKERAAWLQDKKTLEETIVDITTSERSSESERASRENEIKELEERAKAAEERYNRELLSHADAIKTIDGLRAQISSAQANARGNLAAAETARGKLAASESSWKQQKETLDKEISDLISRCKDLTSQNSILHQHLESVSSQAARIRTAAETSTTVPGETENIEDADTKLSELRSVVAYLRKEKDIVDLQLELSKQENVRFKTQIEHLNHSLEEARKTLSEERERAMEAAASEAQHAELMERINQLTLLRESNASLRADCEVQTKRARALDTQLQQLQSELEPTREQLRITRAELDARIGQVAKLEQECRGWQERNKQLLTKYDRIDPAEVQALKDQIEQLITAKAELESQKADVQSADAEKINKLEENLQRLKDLNKRNNDIAKSRFGAHALEREKLNGTITQLEAQILALTTERDELKAKTQDTVAPGASAKEEELNRELEALRTEKVELEKRLQDTAGTVPSETQRAEVEQLKVELARVQQEKDALAAEKTTWATSTSPENAQHAWETEKADLVKARDDATSSAKNATERAERIAAQAKTFREHITKLQEQLKAAQQAHSVEIERVKTEHEAASTKLQEELQASAPSEDGGKHAEELKALEERLQKQHQEELKQAVEAAKATVIASSGANAEGGAVDQKAIDEAIAAKEAELKVKHAEEVAAAVESGRMEASTKSRIRDGQLVRAQAKVKELEGQLQEARKAGFLPAQPAAGPSAAKPPTPTTTTIPGRPSLSRPVPPATTAAAAPAARLPPAGTRPLGTAALPPRPGQPHPTHPLPTGRGRGVPIRGRGGISIRGAAPASAAASPVTSTSTEAAPVAGISIAGAAAKRTREEGDGADGDSTLAKRLKPEGAGKPGPVRLNRDRVTPSS
ncbi:hypothetical protein BDY19DRAFT_324018 [Irpex rosettiformis]|uniref:Uncharacterized protein n=1 Tax=Irpex rosettiformis TaxID=378272 RepID=A0ACB8TYE6_9APHY|nr:hypothetical protein BDY19DRAFT_324018 [Irpex rosettiformis]